MQKKNKQFDRSTNATPHRFIMSSSLTIFRPQPDFTSVCYVWFGCIMYNNIIIYINNNQ